MNQHSLKVNVLACIVLHNIYIEKENNISHKLNLSYDKNDNKWKRAEELKGMFYMVPRRCYVDTSKGAAKLRKGICDYLWYKNELDNEL